MKRFCVYRHFDSNGNILYIGRSINVFSRLKDHERQSRWFDQICSISLEHFESDEEMRAAEEAAIRKERPPFNIGPMGIHTGGPLRYPKQAIWDAKNEPEKI